MPKKFKSGFKEKLHMKTCIRHIYVQEEQKDLGMML